jgi:hypothetical protein
MHQDLEMMEHRTLTLRGAPHRNKTELRWAVSSCSIAFGKTEFTVGISRSAFAPMSWNRAWMQLGHYYPSANTFYVGVINRRYVQALGEGKWSPRKYGTFIDLAQFIIPLQSEKLCLFKFEIRPTASQPRRLAREKRNRDLGLLVSNCYANRSQLLLTTEQFQYRTEHGKRRECSKAIRGSHIESEWADLYPCLVWCSDLVSCVSFL